MRARVGAMARSAAKCASSRRSRSSSGGCAMQARGARAAPLPCRAVVHTRLRVRVGVDEDHLLHLHAPRRVEVVEGHRELGQLDVRVEARRRRVDEAELEVRLAVDEQVDLCARAGGQARVGRTG